MITRTHCLLMLHDFKEVIKDWDWDEDYYQTGQHSREERIAVTRDRLDAIIDVVENSEQFNERGVFNRR